MEQQLTTTIGINVVDVAHFERSDVHVIEPHFADANKAIAVGELAILVAQRAHLRAGQLNARFEGL